jgi:hypothetical protein
MRGLDCVASEGGAWSSTRRGSEESGHTMGQRAARRAQMPRGFESSLHQKGIHRNQRGIHRKINNHSRSSHT